jgi:GT2 family glycosyltransferase
MPQMPTHRSTVHPALTNALSARPSVALLVPSKNRHALLEKSLPSWQRACAELGNASILICDQSPTAFSHPEITVFHAPHLSGLPAARNYLLARCTAEVVIFLDDDSDIAADFVQVVQRLAAHEPHFVAWGPIIEQRSRWINRLHRLTQLGIFSDDRRHTYAPCDRPTRLLFGCCFAVRTHIARDIGFDARRAGYALGEDADFFIRLTQRYPRSVRFARDLRAFHRRDGHDRASPNERGYAKARFLCWWARRHGRHQPCTLFHLALALIAAASGRGNERGNLFGVLRGLGAGNG